MVGDTMDSNELSKSDMVIGRFTIDSFLRLLNKSNFNDKIMSTRDYLFNQMYENELKRNKKNYYINPIRENVVFYRGMDNELHSVNPSIVRLFNPLNASIESHYMGTLLDYPFLNEDSKNNITIKLMARMQHYNYKSRLVDITVNPFVAIYMACYNSFTTNGKLLKFAYKNNTKNDGIVNQLKSVHFTSSMNESVKDNLRLLDSIHKNATFKQKVRIFDNQPVGIIDLQLFKNNAAAYDLRYDAQEGAFIMFLNDVLTPFSPLQIKTMQGLFYEYIDATDKYSFLFFLAKNRITNVTIYPDKELSHEIIKIYNKAKITTKTISLINDFVNLKNNFLELSHINNVDQKHISTLCSKYFNYQSIIEFLLTDYIRIMNYKKRIANIRSAIQQNNPGNTQLIKQINNEIKIHNEGINKLAKTANESLFLVQII